MTRPCAFCGDPTAGGVRSVGARRVRNPASLYRGNPKCSKCDVECEYMRRLWVHGQGQAACFCSLDCLSRWVEAQRLIAVVEER